MTTVPCVRTTTHHCELAPGWGPPHTVATPFTRAEPLPNGTTLLHGIKCDGQPITITEGTNE